MLACYCRPPESEFGFQDVYNGVIRQAGSVDVPHNTAQMDYTGSKNTAKHLTKHYFLRLVTLTVISLPERKFIWSVSGAFFFFFFD